MPPALDQPQDAHYLIVLALVVLVAVMLVVLVPAEMFAVIVTPMMLGLFRFLSLLRFEFMLPGPLWMPVAVAPVPTGVSVQSGSDRGSAERTHAGADHSTLD